MAGALLGAALSAGVGAYNSHQSGKKMEKASRLAAEQQNTAIERGLNESGGYYTEGQNYLAPFREQGVESGEWLGKTLYGSADEQAAALEKYKGNPSYALGTAAIDDAVRLTNDASAGAGQYRSGARIEELGKRMAGMRLQDYNTNWLQPLTSMYGTGANVGVASANMASQHGRDILGARTGQGTAQASGTMGAANANAAGNLGAANYLAYGAGQLGKTDFSKFFKPPASTSSSGTGKLPF